MFFNAQFAALHNSRRRRHQPAIDVAEIERKPLAYLLVKSYSLL